MIRKILQQLGHLDWLRFGIRDRIIRLIHNPDTCNSGEFTVPFFGGTYTGNFDTFLDWSVFYYGAYSKEELRLFDDFLRTIKEPIVLDVGANVGHHTLFAAMRSKQVISFEPFLDVAMKLEQKITDNKLSNVSLFKCALGEKNETAIYVKPKGHNTGTGSFAKCEKDGDTLQLPIKIGDEMLAEHGITDVHFVKIDTEGFEPFVLSGLRKTMARCRPLVFFEWTQEEKKLIKKNFKNLFPENYSFFNFISDTVVLWLFRKPTYKLVPLSDNWPDGNLFAIPNEYIESLKTSDPSSNAAKQIMRKSDKDAQQCAPADSK